MTHTVLVVEDEQQLREMMRDALELNGYAVVTAEHGEDALTKLAEIEHLCLVILDLLMPVMDGRTFISQDAGARGALIGPDRRAHVGAWPDARRRLAG